MAQRFLGGYLWLRERTRENKWLPGKLPESLPSPFSPFLTATGGVFVFVPCAGFSEIFAWRTTDR
jgi:hypothetical protein